MKETTLGGRFFKFPQMTVFKNIQVKLILDF